MRITYGGLTLAALMLSVVAFPSSAATTWQSACQGAIASHSQDQCDRVKAIGHRAAAGPTTGTNENTIWALRKDHRFGAGCETDTWRLADADGHRSAGPSVIFHDQTLNRVVSSASLAAAKLSPETLISDVTNTQRKLLRTKGGEPIPTLKTWLRYAGRWHVPCKVEIKYPPGSPRAVARWVHRFNAPATFYGAPGVSGSTTCSQQGVLSMLTVGLKVGLKYNPVCPMSMEQIAGTGYSYVSVIRPTATQVQHAHAHGLRIGTSTGQDPDYWATLVEMGADFIIAPHPGALTTWLR